MVHYDNSRMFRDYHRSTVNEIGETGLCPISPPIQRRAPFEIRHDSRPPCEGAERSALGRRGGKRVVLLAEAPSNSEPVCVATCLTFGRAGRQTLPQAPYTRLG